MRWETLEEEPCSVARTVAVIGDRWTLLILRECFLRTRRFEAFQAALGITRHLLARIERTPEGFAAVGLDVLDQGGEPFALAAPGKNGEPFGGELLGDRAADVVTRTDDGNCRVSRLQGGSPSQMVSQPCTGLPRGHEPNPQGRPRDAPGGAVGSWRRGVPGCRGPLTKRSFLELVNPLVV